MIRFAEKSEYDRLVEIWDTAVTDTHDFLSREDFDHIKSRLTEYFKAVELYVFENAGNISGFLGVSDDTIEMLFVAERNKGIGSKLLDFALNDLGRTKVDVNEQNIKAFDFYRSHGFNVKGRSETDSEGRLYPIIHMSIENKS